MKSAGPIVVGLTGCFGSGKSSVARLFREMGAAVVDSDRLAHEALEPGSPLFAALKKEFPEALTQGGETLSRSKLGVIIFTNAERRRRLEAMVHPYVFRRMAEEITRTTAPMVVLEVPLLFETGYDVQCAKTVVVESDPEVIKSRLAAKGFSILDIEQRSAAQMSAEEKRKKADFVILNNETIDQTKAEVKRVVHALLSERKGA